MTDTDLVDVREDMVILLALLMIASHGLPTEGEE